MNSPVPSIANGFDMASSVGGEQNAKEISREPSPAPTEDSTFDRIDGDEQEEEEEQHNDRDADGTDVHFSIDSQKFQGEETIKPSDQQGDGEERIKTNDQRDDGEETIKTNDQRGDGEETIKTNDQRGNGEETSKPIIKGDAQHCSSKSADKYSWPIYLKSRISRCKGHFKLLILPLCGALVAIAFLFLLAGNFVNFTQFQTIGEMDKEQPIKATEQIANKVKDDAKTDKWAQSEEIDNKRVKTDKWAQSEATTFSKMKKLSGDWRTSIICLIFGIGLVVGILFARAKHGKMEKKAKLPSESVDTSNFDQMSTDGGEDGARNGDGEQQQHQVANEIGDTIVESTVQNDQHCQKIGQKEENFAILQIHRIGNDNSPKHCPTLKYEFISDDHPQQQQQQIAAENFNPTVAQMIGSLLPGNFGTTMGQLTAQFEMKVQMRERIDELEALFVDIEESKWDTERVQPKGIYKAMLYEKLEEGKKHRWERAFEYAKLFNWSNSVKNDLAKDKFKRSGQILFRMTNFKAFSEGKGPKEVYSDTTEHINGMPWRIQIEYHKDYLGFYLTCDGDLNDMAWSCQVAVELSIVSSTTNDECITKQYTNITNIFNAVGAGWGWRKFAKFEHLMDPKNGIYDGKGDAVTFKAKVTAEKPSRGMAGIRSENILMVNEKKLHVNKYLLAAHSEFLQNLFFGTDAEEMPKIELGGVENAVECFERLIASLYTKNLELDDECVEDVLQLAHRFQFEDHKNRCVDFLLTKSKKSAICKFRLAHQCDIVGMKKKVLREMTKDDFADKFVDSLFAAKQLGADAIKELEKRQKELCGTQ